MYDEFKNVDLELVQIKENAEKFGLEFGKNIEILKMLFAKKDFEFTGEQDKIAEIFEALKIVKLNSQISS